MSIKAKLPTLLAVASIMATTPSAMANDGYRSTVNGVNLGVVYQPPADITDDVCEKFEYDSQRNKEDLQAYKACQKGVSAAKYMAERFAQGEGSYLGCMDALQQGLYKGYLMGKNPTPQMLTEAKRRYQGATMDSAKEQARAQATREGKSVADGKIINRFRSVVGTGKLPQQRTDADMPSHSFRGYDNGYYVDNIGGSFEPVYKLGWVKRGVYGTELIEARVVHRHHANTYSPSKLCSATDVLFQEDLRNVTLWDYFKARGEYRFQKYGWKEKGRTFNYFKNSLSGTHHKLDYLNLEGKTEYGIVTAAKPGKPGVPPTAAVPAKPAVYAEDGVTIITPAQPAIPAKPGVAPVAPVPAVYGQIPVAGRDKAYYQGIHEQSFKQAYQEYYVTQYFGKAFVKAHQQYQGIGETIGQLIGRDAAKEYADELAYNAKYKNDSIAAYNLTWKTNFVTQWDKIWNKFANHSMVEINSIELVGNKSDDIFKKGEKLAANVNLTNLGLKSETIRYTLTGDLAGSGRTHAEKAPTSTRFRVETPLLGTVGNLTPGEKARIGISISGAVKFDSALTTTKSQTIRVSAESEIEKARASVNSIQGAGNILVDITNPSKTDVITKVRANLGSFGVVESDVLQLNGKNKTNATVQFSGLDPLAVIHAGGVSGTVETLIAGEVIDSARISAGIGSRTSELAKYFTALLTGDSSNSGDDTVDGRIQELINIFQDMTQRDIDKEISWKTPSVVNNTIVGQLGNSFMAAKASGRLNDKAIATFAQVGSLLDTLDPGVFSRKAYRAALNKFAQGVEVKKKNK
ncbi:MAG: hypothetical protein CME70_02270 [Halobacteriovorax sp.]|nr:hypothetical protein [Halobacteriovorax sp.]